MVLSEDQVLFSIFPVVKTRQLIGMKCLFKKRSKENVGMKKIINERNHVRSNFIVILRR